jgi:hypothetical protein
MHRANLRIQSTLRVHSLRQEYVLYISMDERYAMHDSV